MTTPAASVRAGRQIATPGLHQRVQGWLSSVAVMSVGLFAISLAVRGLAVLLVDDPLTEGSAYYVEVARNSVSGRGLVIDAIWSYGTPPLVLPRPAFELWQPMATFLAALSMTIFGPTFDAARIGGLMLGGLLAPMAWLVAWDTAARLGLAPRRATFIALTAGLLAATAGPIAMWTAVPDSTLPFAVLAVGACLVMPRAVSGERRALVILGVLVGLAYLTRLEALWLGAAFVILLLLARVPPRARVDRAAAVAVIGALIASPWWLRNLGVFGTPFPGQVTDNLFLTRNLQIYAYSEEIGLAGFLDQGLGGIVTNLGVGLAHNVVIVLLIQAATVTIAGVLGLIFAFRRRGALPHSVAAGPLAALLLTGGISLVATTVLFPVATLWGTFEHASGPLLIALIVVSAFAADALVARVRAARNWERQNAWLATFAIVALTATLTIFQTSSAARLARIEAQTSAAIAANVAPMLSPYGVTGTEPVISDHPIWLASAMGRPGLALPDEPAASVLALARRFGARAVILTETRGRYPAELLPGASGAQECFSQPLDITSSDGAVLFVIDRECVR